MPEIKRPIRVFLCHAHSDAKRVRALYTRLAKDGVDAWLDKEKLIPGSDWAYEIYSAVHQADVVIVCLSKNFNQAGYRQKEVRLALETAMEKPEGEIFIVPARLEECETLESLKKWHWVDLFENNGYERLIQTLQVRADKIGTTLPIRPPSSSPKKLTTQEKLRWVQRGVGLLIALIVTIFSIYWFVQQGPSSVQLTKRPVVCTPQAPNVNIYRATPIFEINEDMSTPILGTIEATSTPAALSQEQALALLQGTPQQGVLFNNYSFLGILVNETKSWSDIQTINLDEANQVQIVVTFLSPQLIRAVYYSEALSHGSAVRNLQLVLDEIARREELIFFVTVLTNANNNIYTTSHMIDIPFREMVIVNSKDEKAHPLNGDYNLIQSINSISEPVSGYLTYPIALINGTECSWILNPSYNKKIILTVPDIFVDGASVGSFTWIIPYSPLFQIGIPLNLQLDMIDPNLVSSAQKPPSPMVSILTPNGLPENTFWQIYAGFLWKQVLLGNY